MEETFLIDSHAHLDDGKFENDRADVIARAKAAGIKTIISVVCWDKTKGFAGLDAIKGHDFIYAAIGIHPHEAKDVKDETPFDLIRELALKMASGPGKVVAIGETGLDYHYEHSPKVLQKEVFARQVALARELNLPLIIHSREADGDTIDILKQEGAGEVGGVFHCFSGSREVAYQALKMDFYISFSGVVTFPGADAVRETVKGVPIEKTLIETDCPYLAPVPERGKRNEPAFVLNTAKAIAEIKNLSLADVARITTLNAGELFGLKQKEEARIAYPIRNSLYLNITNRCTNYCTFCAKFKSYTVKGHYLRLREEPGFVEVIGAIGDPLKYDEIVFCGFGEPLIRLDLVKQLGKHLKRMGSKIRIDTDGLANLVHGKNVLPELMFVDTISVSLNAPDSETYQRLIKTPFCDRAYPAILYFLKEAKRYIPKVIATVVAMPGLDVEACRRVAEDDLGVAFRVREYNEVG